MYLYTSQLHIVRVYLLVRKLCIAYQKKNLYLLLLFIIMSISSKYNNIFETIQMLHHSLLNDPMVK